MNEDMVKVVGKSKVTSSLSLVALVGAIFLGVLTVNELRYPSNYGSQSPQNVITVSGEGEAFAKPDTATFTFSVEESAVTVPEAQKKVDAKSKKAFDFLKENDVAEKDMKTISYQVYPKYEYQQPVVCNQFGCPPQREPKITGYNVSQTVEVKVRDIEKAGDLLAGVGAVQITNLSGLNFTVDKEEVLQAEARKQAIDEAVEKAEELADQLGVRLVRIVNFNESGSYPPIYYGKELALNGFGGGDAAQAVSVAPGETRITSNVTITYEIR